MYIVIADTFHFTFDNLKTAKYAASNGSWIFHRIETVINAEDGLVIAVYDNGKRVDI